LNIWRPEGKTKNLPVMVWIYGGGFVNGGSSPAVYAGTQFARQDVILVSFNYRLGRFGFFGFPALTQEFPDELKGNYGYMDQIAALQWVQRNISAFGGDPRNVTVFGESAGGGSVHMLLTSRLAQGLFHKAIVQSGGGRGNLMGERRLVESKPGLPSAEEIGVNFARKQGIESVDAAALAQLRALPASKIVDGMNLASLCADQGSVVQRPDSRWQNCPGRAGSDLPPRRAGESTDYCRRQQRRYWLWFRSDQRRLVRCIRTAGWAGDCSVRPEWYG
jgi:para-nitrobenzyl esterase